jgi:DNA topoisomerase VI subunit B
MYKPDTDFKPGRLTRWKPPEPVRLTRWKPPEPVIHPAESASGSVVFTKKMREVPVKRAKLTRVPFHVSRLMEFCTRNELVNQTGHAHYEWPLVVVKELLDNALDACEEADIAPVISIEVKGDKIIIIDNGPGIPASVIDGVLNYSIRVSSREAYCSPTRGAQGNALKTILPMGYVLDEQHSGEDASAVTIIEARGIAHRIRFSVDHILQEPKINRLTKSSPVTKGTKITVTLPGVLYEGIAPAVLRVAEAFAWINPHLTLRVVWNGKVKLDFQATNPAWKKWQPSWPTCAHWYDQSRFRRYMPAHIAHRGKTTVREFISEFDGMTGTAKQRIVLAETNSSHMPLRKYFGVRKANTENIAKLLASIKAHTKPVRPTTLGIIGKEHLYRRMEDAGGDPRTFTYNRDLGITAGIPHVSEFAFGLHRDGLGAGSDPSRRIIRGVNWSAAINDPFRQIGQGGESLDSVLAAVKANTSQPIILALHVARAHVSYTDRGKSAIVVEGESQ